MKTCIFPSTFCHVRAQRGGWVTHQPRSLLISLTDLDLDQRPPRYGCPTICIQDSIKAPPHLFERGRIPGPASSDLNYATRSSTWRICLCICFVFSLCHCLCCCLRTLLAKSQAFNLLLSDPRGKKNRLLLILPALLAKIPW